MIRRPTLLSLIFLLLLAAAPSAPTAPQQNQVAASVVLPPRLVAGQPVTLAVLAADGRLVPGIVVELAGRQKVSTDATGRAAFTAPEPGVFVAQVPGTNAGAAALTIPAGAPARVNFARVPAEISTRDRFLVSGSGFRGEADANRVQLGGGRALVLAASPVALVVLPGPNTTPGPTQIVVGTGGAAATAGTTVLALDSQSGQVAPRKKATLVVHVRGTERPQELEARNLSPGVVRFTRGDLQWLTTSGGPDNMAAIEMEGRSVGDFSFRVRLLPATGGPPDMEAARQFLLSGSKRAPAGNKRRIEKLLHLLEHSPPGAAKVTDELGKILASQPAGEYGWLLRAARDALLNR